jgi:hypothetical protein
MEAPPSAENIIIRKPDHNFLEVVVMFCVSLTVSSNSRKFDSTTIEATPSGENIFLQ